ncbi:MAG: OmpH family outer membrane protein [Pseudomonadota bacterium]
MAPLRMLIAALSLTFIALSALPFEASAQGTKIIVVNQSRIVGESAAGQDIQRKLQAIGQTMQSELTPEASALETEGKALQSRTANMTQDAIAANPELMGMVQSFAQKQQALAIKQQRIRQELALTEQNAINELNTVLQPVLEQVFDEQGADIMMNRATVVAAGPNVDVTNDVIAKLNAAATTINVTRARLPEQQAAPATIDQ